MACFDRRDFLRGAAASAAGLALLPLSGLERLALAGAAGKSRVALVRTADRKDGVARALKLFDPKGIKG
ncbi:MAG TPA: twin-arginine translocation signal domain-containing protein, partial [Longimicrobiales bacterium]